MRANFGHDYLDHPAKHVLCVLDAFVVAYRIGDGLLEHVADRKEHLEQLLVRVGAAVLGYCNEALIACEYKIVLGAIAVHSLRVFDQSSSESCKVGSQLVAGDAVVLWLQALGQLLDGSARLDRDAWVIFD